MVDGSCWAWGGVASVVKCCCFFWVHKTNNNYELRARVNLNEISSSVQFNYSFSLVQLNC